VPLYAECHYYECRCAECRNAEYRYAECRGAKMRILKLAVPLFLDSLTNDFNLIFWNMNRSKKKVAVKWSSLLKHCPVNKT
jgi:hypothetical protein